MVAVALGVVAAGAAAAPAAADEQPSILKAYGLDWIERVRDDAWPQPKAQRPVICLLDTGVAVTPDTPADDPNGPIVARLAIDGGSGLPQGNTFEHLHGTTMASVIAAPRNDWGTVGVFPQARIVSVRVTVDDATYITPADMVAGVRLCRRRANDLAAGIASVVMAESGYDQRVSDIPAWETAASGVMASGGLMVAAAGNAADASIVAPLAARSVLSISAGSDERGRCSFAAVASGTLRGPGCSVEVASGSFVWPAGSSAATAAVGALVAALATFEPSESPDRRMERLREGPSSSSDGERIADGSRFADDFKGFVDPAVIPPLSGVLTSSPAGGPTVGTPVVVSRVASRDEDRTVTVLWRPRVSFRRHGTSLVVTRTDRKGGRLYLQLDRTGGSRLLSFDGRSRRIRLTRKSKQITYWAVGHTGGWRSLSTHGKLPR